MSKEGVMILIHLYQHTLSLFLDPPAGSLLLVPPMLCNRSSVLAWQKESGLPLKDSLNAILSIPADTTLFQKFQKTFRKEN